MERERKRENVEEIKTHNRHFQHSSDDGGGGGDGVGGVGGVIHGRAKSVKKAHIADIEVTSHAL